MHKVDLHTHSIASPDGGTTEAQYAHALETGVLDCIAITDHDHLDFALKLHAKYGDQIIVGEEISTTEGELIGLFLSKRVEPGLTAAETALEIKNQGGIVYVPHPFETVRKGLTEQTLQKILNYVDIIETINGRAYAQNKRAQATEWANNHDVAQFASSDTHHSGGLGKTFTMLSALPTRERIVTLSRSGKKHYEKPSLDDVLAPKRNRLMKKIKGSNA